MITIDLFDKEFKLLIKTHHINFSQIFVACSGGVDSMVLSELLKKNGYKIILAHVNYNLRAAESQRDQAFVESYAKKNNIEILVKTIPKEQHQKTGINIQEWARNIRYQWFHQIIQENLSSIILTAHHDDDNLETFIFNAFRGTGLNGLTGISSYNKELKLLRPLLKFSKQQMIDFAQQNNVSFVEDSSNIANDYTRNKIRHDLIPIAEKIFVNPKANLNATITRLQQQNLIFQTLVQQVWAKLIIKENDLIKVPIVKWQKLNPFESYTWEFIRNFGAQPHQIIEIKKLLSAANSAVLPTSSHRFVRNRNFILIQKNHNLKTPHFFLIENFPIDIDTDFFTVSCKTLHRNKVKEIINPNIEYLDLQKLELPLILRPWRVADYFYPLGLNKKKKLSKYFKDLKLSLIDKEKIWVLESNLKICWVLGLRLDDRFKITDKTNEILKVELKLKL